MTVLDRYPIYRINHVYYVVLFLLLLSMVITGCIATVYFYRDCRAYHLIMALMTVGCLLLILSVSEPTVPTGRYQYKIHITNKKYLDQLESNYKLLNQVNDVYLFEDLKSTR